MAGRKRLPIGTFGEITVQKVAVRKYRASTRYRDWDGVTRQVAWTAESRAAAAWALKRELASRMRLGDGADGLAADSPFSDLAAAWLEDMRREHDLADNTKETYERELRTLVMPTFENFTVREVTVGRVESFLKTQRAKSYPRAKHSRTILGMVMSFAVRREIVPRNPVKETSRLKKPKYVPKALTAEQIAQIREAARAWRTEEGRLGPRPDGQIGDLIEVMLGTAARIGEALALRTCDVDMTADPPRVYVTGTIIVSKGKGVFRQAHPKTHESNRAIAVPPFAAKVIRRRLALIAGAGEEALLFHSRKGTPLTPNNVRRTLRAILASAGMTEMEITPHAFRRTGATLIANELSIQAAADVLGHTSTSTTKEHYAEPDRSVNPVAAEVLQRLAPAEPRHAT